MPSSITPKYAKRLVRGKEYARVTLTCAKTARRRDVLLGLYSSPESRQAYHRAIADWESNGRVLPAARVRTHAPRELSVAQLCHTYKTHVVKTYSPAHALFIGLCINALVRLYGEAAASSIGPNAIRAVRDDLANAQAPRRRWSRQTINRAVRLIAQMFRWAVGREFVPASQADAIRAVEPLRRDRCTAPESEPVGCAPGKAIRAVRRFLSPQVAAMIDLQLLTGMRPGEVCQLRAGDIDRSGAVWIARPSRHKNAHRGIERRIYLGPRARKVLERFIDRPEDAPLFSPAEAMEEVRAERYAWRKSHPGAGNTRGDVHKARPQWEPGTAYTNDSYRRAITRACKQAGVESWSPNQLRHNYATEIRRQFGLEAAAILLGHSSALVTDAVYAERDSAKAAAIAAECG